MQHTPLDPAQVSPGVAKVINPATPMPAKMMAAKGLAPLPPADMVTVLYQFSLDADATLAEAAKGTANRLPDNILAAALGSAIDPRVIDFFAHNLVEKSALIETILFNAATSDETFIGLAAKLKERELEILAGNAQRILRTPAIIEALYFNKSARMSTIDRLIEFAVRNGLTLSNIPQFNEIAASILGSAPQQAEAPVAAPPAGDMSGGLDDIFNAALSENFDEGPLGSLEFEEENQDESLNNLSKLSINAKIRLATLGNAFHRMSLIRDSNRMVSMAAIKSPGVSEQEVIKYANNRGLSEDVIRYISEKREWQKSYQVKLALVSNPKTPMAHTLRLLVHLRPNDLRQLMRSKNIPSQVSQAAKRQLQKKQR